jgi:hypothetical protein
MKKYQKPQVTKVALRPEEAALTACKTTTGSGGQGGHCQWGSGTYCVAGTGS